MKWRYTQHLDAAMAETLVALGEPERALGFAERCLNNSVTTHALRNEVKGRLARARALAALGGPDEAEREASDALALAERIRNPAQIRRSHARRGAVLEAAGRVDEATMAYRAALASAEAVAVRLSDPELRETFLSSAEVSEIRDRFVR